MPASFEVPADLTIRAATLLDCDTIAAIYNEGISDGNATFDEFEVGPSRYHRYLQDGSRSRLLCAVKDGIVVAWASVEPISDRHAYRFTGHIALYVARAHRGRGIGSALQGDVEHIAIELGYHSLVSENLSNNPASTAVDLKNGYRQVGEIREAGYRNGEWIGLIVMQKILGSDRGGA